MVYEKRFYFENVQIPEHFQLAIIEWGWVGYEEFCRSRRVLSSEAEGGVG